MEREKYQTTYGGKINNQGLASDFRKEQLMSGYSRKISKKRKYEPEVGCHSGRLQITLLNITLREYYSHELIFFIKPLKKGQFSISEVIS